MIAAATPMLATFPSAETCNQRPQPDGAIWPDLPAPEDVSSRPCETAEDAQRVFIPSGRDIQIYEHVVFMRETQRDVAIDYGISQPRVNQIVRQIAGWMADNTPRFAVGLSPEQQLRLVRYNLAQHLERQQDLLMGAWMESCGLGLVEKVREKQGLPRERERIRRPAFGDVRYLREARRVAFETAKLMGYTPGTPVSDAPQDSPYWAELAKEAEHEPPGAVDGVECEDEEPQEPEELENDLSNSSPPGEKTEETRQEDHDVTAGQDANYAALLGEEERLEATIRELKNDLSNMSHPQPPPGPQPTSDHPQKPLHGRARRRQLQRDAAKREFLQGAG